MPCNARVVIKAKAKVSDVAKVYAAAKEKGIRADLTYGGGFKLAFGQDVSVEISPSGAAVLRSTAADWDTGVEQLRNLMAWLQSSDLLPLTDIGQPETHIHEEAGVQQKNKGVI